MNFTEETIRALFGHEAAEDEDIERLKKYYVKRNAYNTFKSNLPLFILVGHKGVGKSALFTVLKYEDAESGNIALTVKPDDILMLTEENNTFLRKIQLWKTGLARIILSELNSELLSIVTDKIKEPKYKSWVDGITTIMSSMLGKKIADVNESYTDLNASQIVALFKNNVFKEKSITVYLDDLDRGWKNTSADIENLSAMLNAVRDISREMPNLRFRIALRSDVYYSIRTSDETTDKIDGSVRWLTWTNHEIFVMLIKRIETFMGREVDENKLLHQNQRDLQRYLDGVFIGKYSGRGHWDNAPMYQVLMSLVRKRPRDLVKLCTLAAIQASQKGHQLILTDDLEDVFRNYSQDRLVDTCNEYQSEFPKIESLLLQMKPTTKEAQSSHVNRYSRAELLKKLRDIQSRNNYKTRKGKRYTENELAAFLYKINFLTARKVVGGRVVRLYYEENRYVYNEFADFGADYEVHPAYRWALQPMDMNAVFNQIELCD